MFFATRLDRVVFIAFSCVHLRRPPPPLLPPLRPPPMLDDPRALLLRALLPVDPPPPPNALVSRDPLLLGTLRLPTRSPLDAPFAVLLVAALRSLDPLRSRMAACSVRPVPDAAPVLPCCRLPRCA